MVDTVTGVAPVTGAVTPVMAAMVIGVAATGPTYALVTEPV